MLSIVITVVAVFSISCLYAWAAYGLRTTQQEHVDDHAETKVARLVPVEESDWQLEYLLTSDYARNSS